MKISGLIRADKEFGAFAECLKSAHKSSPCYPLAVNGLSGGAQDAFLCESVVEAHKISGAPVLVLVGSDEVRRQTCASLTRSGLNHRLNKLIELSKEYNLYRQDYCGCIYSRKQREIMTNKMSNKLEEIA